MTNYYMYEIKNKLNGKIYVGVHKTKNMDDGYMGSGAALKRDIKKFGLDNFEKKVLQIFESKNEMFEAEINYVNEDFVARKDTYNLRIGGDGGWSHIILRGTVLAVHRDDLDKKIVRIKTDDPKYISGEYIHAAKVHGWFQRDKILVMDNEGYKFRVHRSDPRVISGELVGVNKNKVQVKDKEGNTYLVEKTDPRYISGELVGIMKGFVVVQDSEGHRFRVSKDDPRYISGELKHINCFRDYKKVTR